MSSGREKRPESRAGSGSGSVQRRAAAPGKRTLTSHLPGPVQAREATRGSGQSPEAGSTPTTRAQVGPGHGSPIPRLEEIRSGSAGTDDPSRIAADGVAGPAQALPHAAAIQRSFGAHDVSGARAHVGGAAAQATDALGAEAYATGDHVAFRESPDLHTAAHEAAHVVQQRARVHPDGGMGVHGDRHEQQADAVADRVVRGRGADDLLDEIAGGAPDRDASPPATGETVQRKPARGESEAAGRPGDPGGHAATGMEKALAGHGVADPGRASSRSWSTSETVAGDSLRIEHEYVYTQTGDRESGTEGLLIARRTMRVELQAGTRFATRVEVQVTGSARYDANLTPADLEQAVLHWPAVVAEHSAEVEVHRGRESQTASLGGRPHRAGQSLAATVTGDRLLAYETAAEQRIWAVRDLLGRLDLRDRGEDWLRQVQPAVKQTIEELHAYRAAIDAQASNDLDPVAPSREPLERAAEILDQLAQARRSLSDPDARREADDLFHRLRTAHIAASSAHVPDPALGAGVLTGIAEMVRMGRDVALKGADELGDATGAWNLEWDAASGVGKLREDGKGWGDITVAMVDGMVDQIDQAILHAADGDFRPLADMGLQLAFDALVGAASAGKAARGARAAARAGQSATEVARARIAALAGQTRQAIAKLSEDAPRWVRDELDAVGRAATESLRAPQTQAVGAIAGGADASVKELFDQFARAHQRARLDTSIDRARQSLVGRGLAGRGDTVFQAIEQLARQPGLSDAAVRALKVVLDSGVRASDDAAGFLKALERALPLASRFDPEDFANLLRRSATADNPIAFLADLEWLAAFKPEARHALAGRIASGRLDLRLLRRSGSSLPELEALATNPDTDWSALQPRPAPPQALIKALREFHGRELRFGRETFQLDRAGLKHILERHHPRYWNGTTKFSQTFVESMSVDDVVEAIDDVMRQNRARLIEKGTRGLYAVRGVHAGTRYHVGLKNGRVAQFYPLP